jgi:hypothetical protein
MSLSAFSPPYIISATNTGYAYGNTPPIITVDSSVPSTKYSNSNITQYFTITYEVGIAPSGLVLSAGSPVSTSAVTVVDSTTLMLEVSVSASGSIGISATDNGGLTSTETVSDYIIDTSVTGPLGSSSDVYGPGIKYTLHNPSDRFVITKDGNNTGSVHVTVTDDIEIVYESGNPSNWIGLVPGSVGEIDNTSWVQTTSAIVEFDVINISATGDVIVSATDFWGGNTNKESDVRWMVGCSDNDRLINLVNFLPQHLYDSETFDFTKLFENFLNTMYEDRDHPCNYGILKKIEQIGDLHDPQLMDSEYLQFYANFLGYDLTLNRGEIGNITNEVAADGTYIDDEESKKYLRFVVENLPNWYKIKSTRNAVKIMLFSFGIIGDLFTLFSNDYDKKWISDREDDRSSVGTQLPSEYYPTPHFQLAINLRRTAPTWLQNLGPILNAIDSIRPINTVFERFAMYYDMDPAIINVVAGSPHISQSVYIDWTNSPATCASTYTNMYSNSVDGNLDY